MFVIYLVYSLLQPAGVWFSKLLVDAVRLNQTTAALLIAAATVRAGADAVVATLPNGLDTPLGRQFDDGLELSIGQWQKLALARAFFRDAPLQVLDELTAALDAQAEYDVYLRFQELTRGRTTLLISHRFSTVRMADRILVCWRTDASLKPAAIRSW